MSPQTSDVKAVIPPKLADTGITAPITALGIFTAALALIYIMKIKVER